MRSAHDPRLCWHPVNAMPDGSPPPVAQLYAAHIKVDGANILSIYAGGQTLDMARKAMVIAERKAGMTLHRAAREVDPFRLLPFAVCVVPFLVGVGVMLRSLVELIARLLP